MKRLKNKNILITGGTRGIGLGLYSIVISWLTAISNGKSASVYRKLAKNGPLPITKVPRNGVLGDHSRMSSKRN